MFFCAGNYVAGSGNIEYIHFNLPKLLFIAGSTNFNSYYLSVITKISNFLYNVQYLLFEIVLKKIISPTKSKDLILCLFSSTSDSFELRYP